MSATVKTRRCSDCRRYRPIDEYWKSSASKSGLNAYCKDCAGHHYREYQENMRLREKIVIAEKFCYDCKQVKGIEHFTINRSSKDNLDHFCRACKKIRHHNWASNPATWPMRKAIWAKSKYGIEPQEYKRMVESQKGACAICSEQMGERPHIDHDHETGFVRELLCSGCNSRLSGLENASFMERAIAYLEKHRQVARKVSPKQDSMRFVIPGRKQIATLF